MNKRTQSFGGGWRSEEAADTSCTRFCLKIEISDGQLELKAQSVKSVKHVSDLVGYLMRNGTRRRKSALVLLCGLSQQLCTYWLTLIYQSGTGMVIMWSGIAIMCFLLHLNPTFVFFLSDTHAQRSWGKSIVTCYILQVTVSLWLTGESECMPHPPRRHSSIFCLDSWILNEHSYRLLVLFWVNDHEFIYFLQTVCSN